jgi:hypothetical protein
VDENLFYKGVDKSAVHGARLHQSHEALPDEAASLNSESDAQRQDPNASQNSVDPGHPPYPFKSGDNLLALTKKHNVCILILKIQRTLYREVD